MKKHILISLIILYSTAGSILSQTSIPGGIVSGTWTKANSPYLIQGAIMVANNTALTIQAGVKVEFQGDYKFLVLGQLLAVGSSIDTITFTSKDISVGWLGVRFDSTAAANDTSKFFYCKFNYGKANGTSSITNGGAMYINSFSKVIVSNCLISNCYAKDWGGGIYCKLSNPIFTNNTITNNLASNFGGGGIYFENGNPTISYNNISNNKALSNGRGGGICCYNSINSIISNNTFSNNTTFRGGAIFASGGSPNIYKNIILNNTASAVGSGVNCEFSDSKISSNTFSNNIGSVIACEGNSPNILNNTISNNNGEGIKCFINNGSSTPIISNNIISYNIGNGISCSISTPNISHNFISNNDGSGISCSNSSSSISNNSISNNASKTFGGGIYCSNSSPTITNNSIENNLATKGGALYCTSSSSPIILNTIMWGNITSSSGNQVYLDDQSSKPNFYYCDIQGGSSVFGINTNVFYLGTYANNINSDPFFVLPSSGSGSGFNGVTSNWSLQSNSPCINAGNPSGSYPTLDIVGNPRLKGCCVDIGAFEVQTGLGLVDYNLLTKINIYPNPLSTKAVLESNYYFNKAVITVYDIYGKLVKQMNHISEQAVTITRDNLPCGLYLIQLTENNKVLASNKLVITD